MDERVIDVGDSRGIFAILNSIQDTVGKQAIVVDRLERDVKLNLDMLTSLNKIIREGNGQRSLLTRMDLMESGVMEIRSNFSDMRKLLQDSANENTKGKWTVTNSIIVGVLSIIAAMMAGLLGLAVRAMIKS